MPVFQDPVPEGHFNEITIPLKRVQNLFLIEATIDSIHGNFIFDTGAPHLVLNKTYFRNGKRSESNTYGITGGGDNVMNTKVDSLSLGDLYFTKVDADIVNLGHIEDARGVKILGLLGANLFLDLVIEIDVKENTLHLYRPAYYDSLMTTAGTVADMELPLEIENDIIFMPAVCAEKKMRFCLDTGAETNILGNTVSNKVLKLFSLTTRTSLGGSSNQNMSVLNGQISAIAIGDSVFEKMPFVLTNLSYLIAAYDTQFDGVLGYYFLSQGRILIDSRKKKLMMYFYNAN